MFSCYNRLQIQKYSPKIVYFTEHKVSLTKLRLNSVQLCTFTLRRNSQTLSLVYNAQVFSNCRKVTLVFSSIVPSKPALWISEVLVSNIQLRNNFDIRLLQLRKHSKISVRNSFLSATRLKTCLSPQCRSEVPCYPLERSAGIT